MTKKIDDLAARLQGNMIALVAMKNKVSMPEGEAPPTPPVPAPEDLQTYEKLLADAKSTIEALEAEVKKENKTPDTGSGGGGLGSPAAAAQQAHETDATKSKSSPKT